MVTKNDTMASMENNNQKQIAGAILLAGVIIAGAILLRGSNAPISNVPDVNNAQKTISPGRPVSADDHILGDINAKIVIIEYSDLECPFCKVFHNTLHQVVDSNNGKVAWVYIHY